MRLNQVLTEQELNELGLRAALGRGVRAIGSGLRGVAGAGASAAGTLAGIGSAFKQGYRAGMDPDSVPKSDKPAGPLAQKFQAAKAKVLGTGEPTSGQAAPAAGQTAPSTAAAPAPGQARGSKPGAPAVDVQMGNVINQMRNFQPTGQKPLPPNSKAAQSIQADMGKVAVNKDYLILVGNKIASLDKAGYDVSGLHKAYMGQLAKGQRAKSIQESKLEKIYQGLLNKDADLIQDLKESGYDIDQTFDTVSRKLQETRKIRQIFEGTYDYSTEDEFDRVKDLISKLK